MVYPGAPNSPAMVRSINFSSKLPPKQINSVISANNMYLHSKKLGFSSCGSKEGSRLTSFQRDKVWKEVRVDERGKTHLTSTQGLLFVFLVPIEKEHGFLVTMTNRKIGNWVCKIGNAPMNIIYLPVMFWAQACLQSWNQCRDMANKYP